MFAAACKLGLEGIVSKKREAPYKSWAIKGVAENQKPKCSGSDTRCGWNFLDRGTQTSVMS